MPSGAQGFLETIGASPLSGGCVHGDNHDIPTVITPTPRSAKTPLAPLRTLWRADTDTQRARYMPECVEQMQRVADAMSGKHMIAEVMDTRDPVEGSWRIKVLVEQDAHDEVEMDFPVPLPPYRSLYSC
jgi:hypothetical protein